MIHLKPAEGTARFLCCFQSSLMMKPGDTTTEDPAQVTCKEEIPYEALERMLVAPMDRHNAMAESIKQLIWEMLVDRRLNNTFQILPENRREFLETFGKRLRKLEETDESAGKDMLLTIRKEQVGEIKRIAKAFREHCANLTAMLIKVHQANPPIPLEEVPDACASGDCGGEECERLPTCDARAAAIAHNKLAREIEKLLLHDPLA